MLLTAYDFIGTAQNPQAPRLHRSHGRSLSAMHLVTGNTALLVSFSDEPPAAMLEPVVSH